MNWKIKMAVCFALFLTALALTVSTAAGDGDNAAVTEMAAVSQERETGYILTERDGYVVICNARFLGKVQRFC